jgi:putative ABC transport system ATP-binding protein
MLLVDEPTANLDDDAVASVLILLEHTARQVNATLLIATHDSRVAQALSQATLLRLSPPVVEAA